MGSCATEISGAVQRPSVMLSPQVSAKEMIFVEAGGNSRWKNRLLDSECLTSPLLPLGHFLLNKIFLFSKCLPSLWHLNAEVSSF